MIKQSVFAVCAVLLFASSAHAGTWKTKTYKTSGGWSLVEQDGDVYVELSADFATKSVPDLKLFLSKNKSSDVSAKNASQGVFVAKVKSNKGKQRYKLPKGTSASDFKSIVLHCHKYSVLIAVGDL